MKKTSKKIIVIVGPNASGKSEFGIKIAKKLGGEIISADSRQVYKGLDIGSGKVLGKWKNKPKIKNSKFFVYKNILHHCIDIANPKKQFTALDFKNCAEKAVADILSRGKIPIIVGGTGFYIDAALGRIKLGGVPPNLELRKRIAEKSAGELLKMLKKLDPKRAETIEQKNPRRLVRAIEIAQHVLRKNLAQRDGASRAIRQQANMRVFEKNHAALTIQWMGIKRSPEDLKKRIHRRLIARLPGIIRETKKLHANPPAGGVVSWKRLFELGLEYRYASLYLRNKLDKDQLISQLQTAIWHYAKRQMTWFKKNKKIKWISAKSL